METHARHTLIGAFTLLVLVSALAFVLWLSKQSSADTYTDYQVVFNEAVTGLSQGAPVQYNGIKIGEVTQLKLDSRDTRRVIVRIRVAEPSPVKQDTQATLGFSGVTGVAHLRLTGGDPHSPPLRPADGATVAMIIASPSDLERLKASGEDVMLNISKAVAKMSELLSAENVAHVSSIIGNLDQLVATVNAQRGDLAQTIQRLAVASEHLKTTLASIDATARKADRLVDQDARQTLASINRTLGSVDQAVNSANALLVDNRAAVASFSQHGLREVGPALQDLRNTLESLQRLSDQLSRSNSALLGNSQPKEFQAK